MRLRKCMVCLGQFPVKLEAVMQAISGQARKCVDCGFLAIRRKIDRALIEAEQRFRESAYTPDASQYELLPECYHRLWHERDIKSNDKQHILEFINQDRPCDSFAPWKPCRSPTEHQEMIERQALMDFQREQAAKSAKDAEDAREFQKSQAESQRCHERWTLAIAIGSMVVAAYASLKQKEPQPAPIVKPIFQPAFQVVIPADPKENPAIRPVESDPTKPPA